MWLPELLLVAFVPGALLFRAPVLQRERRATLPAEERVFWSVVISIAWTSIVALALAAASRYTLQRLLAVDGALSLAVLATWRTRLLYRGSAPRAEWPAIYPLALVAVGAAVFFPVSEFVVGGKDPGVYVNEGIAIAQRGALVITDQLVASIPPVLRDLFFPRYPDPRYYSIRFMGFFLVDPMKGVVVGQFPHLYPIWIAIGYGLNGVAGALQAIAFCAIFGLAAVYFAGARLIGRLPAWCACALLALSVVEVWFGRYPNSEMALQALLFAGLLAFARAHLDDDPFFAPVAGVALGLLVFVRFDAVLAWVAVACASVLLLFQGRRPRAWFLAPLGVAAVAVAAYTATVMRPGFGSYQRFYENLTTGDWARAAAAVAVAVGLLALTRSTRAARIVSRWTPVALSTIVVVAVVYAFFFRVPGGRLAAHDANSLRTFTWYFPWAGLVAAVAGFVLLAWRRFWRDPALLLVTLVYGLFVFYKIRIVPEHFWMTRRFVPVILPAAYLLLAAAAFYRSWWTTKKSQPDPTRTLRLAGWLLPLAFVALVAGVQWRAAQPVLAHVEYQGLSPLVENFSHHFGDKDLVIVESRRSSDLQVLALPLAYTFQRNVLVLATPRPDRMLFRGFLDWARSRYANVYFMGSGGTDLLSRGVAVKPLATYRFQVPEYESAMNAYPTGPRGKEFDFSLYRFVDPPDQLPPFDLTLGANDDLFVVRFNAKEEINGQSYRWTTDSSYVTLLGMDGRSRKLVLWMDQGARPASAGSAVVKCYLDNEAIGEARVEGRGFQPYEFPIPASIAAAAEKREEPVLLRLVTPAWSPSKASGLDDDRTLGVMVRRVAIQ